MNILINISLHLSSLISSVKGYVHLILRNCFPRKSLSINTIIKSLRVFHYICNIGRIITSFKMLISQVTSGLLRLRFFTNEVRILMILNILFLQTAHSQFCLFSVALLFLIDLKSSLNIKDVNFLSFIYVANIFHEFSVF